MQDRLLDELVMLAHALGLEERALALLGEGNVSTRVDDGTFLVKASGSSLGTLGAGDISRVRLGAVLAGLEHPTMSEEDVETLLTDSLTDPSHKKAFSRNVFACTLPHRGRGFVGGSHAHGLGQRDSL